MAGYSIESELARGGQGVVYRAVQSATRRPAALKVLRDGALASPAARRRFQREIELIAELRHPNLLTVYDAGTTRDGRAFFAMEFVEGVCLARWLEQWRAGAPPSAPLRQTLRPLLTLFVKICNAVGYAHQRGVIHRDLKPSNVLVDRAGQPRVVDFGLARLIAPEGAAALTTAEQIAGTIPYLSPEQARGLPDAVDVRSDVYSLGVMLYEALAGEYPYPVEADTLATIRHIAETPATPPQRRPGGRGRIDDELATIVLKALAKERERRYQTAGELARDLERYMEGEAIEARRDSAAYLFRRLLRRHAVVAVLSAVFAVSVLILVLALALMVASQNRLRMVAEKRFQDVRDLARSFIFEFDPKIRRLPGSAEARRLVVEKGLAYLDALAREAPDDPALQREIAAGYSTIGDIQADSTSSNLGKALDAVASYRKALEILERAADVEKPDVKHASALPLARLRLADALLGQRDTDAALVLCRSALEQTEALRRRFPNDDDLVDLHADALERIGNVMAARGDRGSADAHYTRAAQLAEERAARRPDDPQLQRDLAVSYTKRAQIHHAAGDHAAALEYFRKYLAIVERLRAAGPDDIVSLRDAAIGYQWLGILLLETKRPFEAIEPLGVSRALLERLFSADAANADAGLTLTATLTRLCEAQVAAGLLDAAIGTAGANLDISRRIVDRSADSPGAERQLGVALYKLFECHQAAAGKTDDAGLRRQHESAACERLQECFDWFDQLRRAGRLAPADAGVPAELQAELDRCRAATAPAGNRSS
ncbi:Serine/threonine-protein kinase PknB [Phycisphaerae bacterium RAS1]|nr:Serine/threonine-protein kinase PknB [Phycisphaerae bacterium RAS1]